MFNSERIQAVYGVLRAKQYTCFSFPVTTTQFPLYLSLSVNAAASLNTSLTPTLVVNASYNASTVYYPSDLLSFYYSAGSNPLQNMPARPLLVASYFSHGVPSANSLQFQATPSDSTGLRLGINFVPGTDGAFTQVQNKNDIVATPFLVILTPVQILLLSQSGIMLAAALVSIDSFVTVNLTRDGCALMNCSNGGVCNNGQCQVCYCSIS